MSIVHVLKTPIAEVTKSTQIYREMKQDKKSLQSGDLSLAAYRTRTHENKVKLTRVATPILMTTLAVSFFCMERCFESYLSGVPFSEIITPDVDKLCEMFSTSFGVNPFHDEVFLKALKEAPTDALSGYTNYVTTGVSNLISSFYDEYISGPFLLTTASIYGAVGGVMKGFDFIAGSAGSFGLDREREIEEAKLDILRKNYQDPVFDNLNNEEIFAMMKSFNHVLHNYHLGKKKIIKQVILKTGNLTDLFIKPFRKVFNKSTNSKETLMNSASEYLNLGFNEENPELSLIDYGIKKSEFNLLATKNGVLGRSDKVNYVFLLNERSLISAYKEKLKDDVKLAFSLKIEGLLTGKISLDDDFKKDLSQMRLFIESNSVKHVSLKRLEIPEDLKLFEKITSLLQRNGCEELAKFKKINKDKSYVHFLKMFAPHMVEETEDITVINNFSFLSYFENEKKRFVGIDLLDKKINDYQEAMALANETYNTEDFMICKQKIESLMEEKLDLSHLFNEKSILKKEKNTEGEFIFKSDIVLTSSIYKDDMVQPENLNHHVVVKNHIMEKEKNLMLAGSALKEKGVVYENAHKASKITSVLDELYAESDSEIKEKSESRVAFKNSRKRYKR